MRSTLAHRSSPWTRDLTIACASSACPRAFAFPTARDDEQASELWRVTRRYAMEATNTHVTHARVRRIAWEHDGCVHTAVVGERLACTGDRVMAILEAADAYLVCTTTHGFLRAQPVLADKAELRDLELFEPLPDDQYW